MQGRPYQYHLSWEHRDFPKGAFYVSNGTSTASKAEKHDRNARFFAKKKLLPGTKVYVVFSGDHGDVLGDNKDGVFPAFDSIRAAKNHIYDDMTDLFEAKEYIIEDIPDDVYDGDARVSSFNEVKRRLVEWYGNNINNYGDGKNVVLDGSRYHTYYYGIMEFMIID